MGYLGCRVIHPLHRHKLGPSCKWKPSPEAHDGVSLARLVLDAQDRRKKHRGNRDVSVTTVIHDLEVMDILASPTTSQMFLQCCREHLCEEAALFLIAIQEIKERGVTKQGDLLTVEGMGMVGKIFTDFIQPGSLYEIPLPTPIHVLLLEHVLPTELPLDYQQPWAIVRLVRTRSHKAKKKVFAMTPLSTLQEVDEEADLGPGGPTPPNSEPFLPG